MNCPVKIGEKVSFIPEGFADGPIVTGPGGEKLSSRVTGRVIFVNEQHRYYLVEARVNGSRICESFKF